MTKKAKEEEIKAEEPTPEKPHEEPLKVEEAEPGETVVIKPGTYPISEEPTAEGPKEGTVRAVEPGEVFELEGKRVRLKAIDGDIARIVVLQKQEIKVTQRRTGEIEIGVETLEIPADTEI